MSEEQRNVLFFCDFDMCMSWDLGNVVIFQHKLWHSVSGLQRKCHLSFPITIFLKSLLFLSSFLWKTRTNAKPWISPLATLIHRADFLKVLPCIQVVLQNTLFALRSILPIFAILLNSQILPFSGSHQWIFTWIVIGIFYTLFSLHVTPLLISFYSKQDPFDVLKFYRKIWFHIRLDTQGFAINNDCSVTFKSMHNNAFFDFLRLLEQD
jgi:hypothetical protein